MIKRHNSLVFVKNLINFAPFYYKLSPKKQSKRKNNHINMDKNKIVSEKVKAVRESKNISREEL